MELLAAYGRNLHQRAIRRARTAAGWYVQHGTNRQYLSIYENSLIDHKNLLAAPWISEISSS
jgi:hypothetical protein